MLTCTDKGDRTIIAIQEECPFDVGIVQGLADLLVVFVRTTAGDNGQHTLIAAAVNALIERQREVARVDALRIDARTSARLDVGDVAWCSKDGSDRCQSKASEQSDLRHFR